MTQNTIIPVLKNGSIEGTLICEQAHEFAFRVFKWYGQSPFFDAPRGHVVFSDSERAFRHRNDLGSSRAYSFSPARLAVLLFAEPERTLRVLHHYLLTNECTMLVDELKRPFRVIYRTSNKLDMRKHNLRCPAIAEPVHKAPECLPLSERTLNEILYLQRHG